MGRFALAAVEHVQNFAVRRYERKEKKCMALCFGGSRESKAGGGEFRAKGVAKEGKAVYRKSERTVVHECPDLCSTQNAPHHFPGITLTEALPAKKRPAILYVQHRCACRSPLPLGNINMHTYLGNSLETPRVRASAPTCLSKIRGGTTRPVRRSQK